MGHVISMDYIHYNTIRYLGESDMIFYMKSIIIQACNLYNNVWT